MLGTSEVQAAGTVLECSRLTAADFCRCNVTRQWPVQSNAAAERTVVVPAAGHSPRSCCIQGVRLLSLAEPYLPLELHCRQLKYVEASKLRTGQVRPVRSVRCGPGVDLTETGRTPRQSQAVRGLVVHILQTACWQCPSLLIWPCQQRLEEAQPLNDWSSHCSLSEALSSMFAPSCHTMLWA